MMPLKILELWKQNGLCQHGKLCPRCLLEFSMFQYTEGFSISATSWLYVSLFQRLDRGSLEVDSSSHHRELFAIIFDFLFLFCREEDGNIDPLSLFLSPNLLPSDNGGSNCRILVVIISCYSEYSSQLGKLSWTLQSFNQQPWSAPVPQVFRPGNLVFGLFPSISLVLPPLLSKGDINTCFGQWWTLTSDNDLSILVASHLPSGEISDILTRISNSIYHHYLVFSAWQRWA